MLFNELNLKESSLKAIEALGFEAPTEIQEKSIPILLENDIDFIGQAQTGTGKTAAFALPLFEKLDLKSKDIQSLILAPTRELANQICEEFKKLSRFETVRTLAVYGGQPVSSQLRELRQSKPQVIVGTPGRVLDFIKRGALKLETCKYVVLDEADEMLDMGFFDDVNTILAAAGESANKKIWMFSATMPKPILNLVNKHFCDPELVKVTKKILTADSVKQEFCVVKRRDQIEGLCRYLDYHQNTYAIVFMRTKVGAKELTDELNMRGFPSDALHGDMSQEQRDLTMKKFKEKKISLLVCTDVAARGIDVSDLTHVINFSLPQDNESYVHRIGRTGRGGNQGIALSIIEPGEARRIRDIERITKAKIEKIDLPTIAQIKKVLRDKSYSEFDLSMEGFVIQDSEDFEKFKERFGDVDKEELLKGAFSFIYNQSLKRYRNA
ncbi:MAG: DEAD/DEAH box helicase, partial [Bacteriovoracaceae bacterium]